MNFEFKCPQCAQTVEADDSYCGQVVLCPHCEKGIVVPQVKPSPALVSLHSRTDSASPLAPRTYNKRPVHIEKPPHGPSHWQERNEDNPSHKDQASQVLPHERPNPFSSLRDQAGTHTLEEQKRRKERTILIVVVAAFIAMMCYITGGLWLIANKFSARYDQLQVALAELRDRDNNENASEELEKLARRIDEIVSQMEDKIKIQEEYNATFKNMLDSMSKRITDVEENVADDAEQFSNGNKNLEEKCESLTQQITELSRKVIGEHEPVQSFAQLPVQPKIGAPQQSINVPQKTEKTASSPSESIVDLQRQLADISAEVKRLVNSNPSCYLNPKASSIVNVQKTSGGNKYSINSIILVRDEFYCTKCKRSFSKTTRSPCCDVSRHRSFNSWREARDNVDETQKINTRIDELRNEMAQLKKRIQALGQ